MTPPHSVRRETTREIATALSSASPTDLRSLQVKLTYVGSQLKPVPTVVFTTYHHLLQLGRFVPLRRADLSYANDERSLWNFTVTPDEMRRAAKVLAGLAGRPPELGPPELSVMADLSGSRLGGLAFEAVLDAASAERLTRLLAEEVFEAGALGLRLLRQLREILGWEGGQ